MNIIVKPTQLDDTAMNIIVLWPLLFGPSQERRPKYNNECTPELNPSWDPAVRTYCLCDIRQHYLHVMSVCYHLNNDLSQVIHLMCRKPIIEEKIKIHKMEEDKYNFKI